jgi:hypothetical protein
MLIKRVELWLWCSNTEEQETKRKLLLCAINNREPTEFKEEHISRYYFKMLKNTDLDTAIASIGLKKYIPFHKLTFEVTDEVLTLVIYHDILLHDAMYNSDSTYVLTPIGSSKARLNELYAGYGMPERYFV